MRPNLLLITADQWRGDCMGAMGHPVLQTPNIDGLAAEGVLFRRHFSQSAPCAPARACLYTGLYQMTNRVVRNGTPLDDRHDNLAKALRRAGYEPVLFGHTDQAIDPRTVDGDDPRLRTYEGVLPGFTAQTLLPEAAGPWLAWLRKRGVVARADDVRAIHRPRSGPSAMPTRSPPVYRADETETAFITDEFLGWLAEQPAGRPWFAHVSYLRPHPPFIVPEPFDQMYDATDGPPFQRAASPEREAAQHPLVAAWLQTAMLQGFLVDSGEGPVADLPDEGFRTIRAVYWGMVSEVDRQIGRLLDGLAAAGGKPQTVILLTSDHGEMLGDHWTLGKFGYFDASYHVPLIIRDPRRAGGIIVDAFTAAVDIMPTMLDLVGRRIPGQLDGRSLAPFVLGKPPATWRTEVHWEYDFRSFVSGEMRSRLGLDIDSCGLAVLRDEHHKYVHFTKLPPLLFDLAEDPGELVDRASDPAKAGVRLEMAERLLSWRARHQDRRLANLVLTADGVLDERRALGG